jgi:hypothetical protein
MILGGCNHDGLFTRPLHSLSAFRMEDDGVRSLSFRMVSLFYFSSSEEPHGEVVYRFNQGPCSCRKSGRGVLGSRRTLNEKRLCGWGEALEKISLADRNTREGIRDFSRQKTLEGMGENDERAKRLDAIKLSTGCARQAR